MEGLYEQKQRPAFPVAPHGIDELLHVFRCGIRPSRTDFRKVLKHQLR